MTHRDPRRRLVELFPQFLIRRRRGWRGLDDLVIEAGVTRSQVLLLRALVQETEPGAGMSADELRASLFNPYSTIHPWQPDLAPLVERGLMFDDGARYTVTPQGRELIEAAERAAHAYLATLTPIRAAELERLAAAIVPIAEAVIAAEQPERRPHLARIFRLPLSADGEPMVNLEWAIYALWLARDDAHNAAWRARDFDGPALDLLTRLWAGEAGTIDALIDVLAASQRPEDVTAGVDRLIATGYVERDDSRLQLTAHGCAARDAIEAETDRVYFAPWPPLADDEIAWMIGALRRLIDRL
jgi:DNA-binding MarR family transcriptional regulator